MSVTNHTTNVTISQFLAALNGDHPTGWRVVWSKQDKSNLSMWLPANDFSRTERVALALANRYDVYFGVGLQADKGDSTQRGKAETVIAIPGLWLDVDCQGGVHSATSLPTFDEAREFLELFGLAPSIIVHTGGGLHLYWLFPRPWVFKDEVDRKQAANQVARFQKAMITLALDRGWKMDNTSDLARVLRLPDTLNHKTTPPAPVLVELWEPSRRYGYEEVEAAIGVLEARAGVGGNSSHSSNYSHQRQADNSLPQADLILQRCAWIRHCKVDAANLPEPEWYAMVGVTARCQNGPALVHQWSRPYPRYDPDETDKKIHHALTDADGPITCNKVRADFGASCQGCTHEVRSPINLGRERQAPEWEPPVPFTEHDLPAFPTDTLPGWLRDFVVAEAEATQTPVDLAGLAGIGVLSTALAKKVVVLIREGWKEPVNTYSTTVFPSGSRKTIVFDDATGPISEYENELVEAATPEIEARGDNFVINLARHPRKVLSLLAF